MLAARRLWHPCCCGLVAFVTLNYPSAPFMCWQIWPAYTSFLVTSPPPKIDAFSVAIHSDDEATHRLDSDDRTGLRVGFLRDAHSSGAPRSTAYGFARPINCPARWLGRAGLSCAGRCRVYCRLCNGRDLFAGASLQSVSTATGGVPATWSRCASRSLPTNHLVGAEQFFFFCGSSAADPDQYGPGHIDEGTNRSHPARSHRACHQAERSRRPRNPRERPGGCVINPPRR
jgi:hypothetical protein